MADSMLDTEPRCVSRWVTRFSFDADAIASIQFAEAARVAVEDIEDNARITSGLDYRQAHERGLIGDDDYTKIERILADPVGCCLPWAYLYQEEMLFPGNENNPVYRQRHDSIIERALSEGPTSMYWWSTPFMCMSINGDLLERALGVAAGSGWKYHFPYHDLSDCGPHARNLYHAVLVVSTEPNKADDPLPRTLVSDIVLDIDMPNHGAVDGPLERKHDYDIYDLFWTCVSGASGDVAPLRDQVVRTTTLYRYRDDLPPECRVGK